MDPVVLECHSPPEFLLVVSLGRVRYRQRKLRSTQLVDTAIDGLSDLRLEYLRPWVAWIAGVMVFLLGLAYFVASIFGPSDGSPIRLDMLLPTVFGLGLALLVGTRVRLSWTQGGQRHVVTQPSTINRWLRASVGRSMQEAFVLLRDPEARRRGAERTLAEHREAAGTLVEATAGEDRRLCPDGSCVGLLGEDGRCKVCGK